MTVTTFELDPVTVALWAWLETAIGVPVEDSIAVPDPPAVYAVLFQLPAPRSGLALFAAESQIDATYQVTSVGSVPSQARTVADRVRKAIAGTNRLGAYTTAMALPGVAVVRRRSNDDGYLDVVKGICQWPETYRLTLVPA